MADKTNIKRCKRYCIAFGCKNSTKVTPGLSLFKLPRQKESRAIWLKTIGREDLLQKENLKHDSYEVCSEHFDDSVIKSIKKLKVKAMPSRSFCNKLLMNIPSTSNNTNSNETLAKISLKRKHGLEKLNKQVFKPKRRIPHLDNGVMTRIQNLKHLHNELVLKKFNNTYNAEYKLYALDLHYPNPNAYQCLQTALVLPNINVFKRFKLKIPPKLDERVFRTVSIKIGSLPEEAKYCIICIEKMAIRPSLYYDIRGDELVGFHNIFRNYSLEIAQNAYTIVLQGIYFNWKQPIAYTFAGTGYQVELGVWIEEIITRLLNMGIEIKAIVSNQDSNLEKYAKEIKKVTVDCPYLFVSGRKIYYSFDIPNLFNIVRDILLSSNLYYNGNYVSWEYIKRLYDDQKHRDIKLIPKIADAHIQPDDSQKTNLKYSVQVFSRAMAAALSLYIDCEKISDGARTTVKFIETMNELFDVLNTTNRKSGKHLQTAFILSKEQQTILDNAKDMFVNIQSENVHILSSNDSQFSVFQNFQISIQSIQQLFKDLKKKGFKYLSTRKIHHDCLNKFHDCVTKQSRSGNPTAIQYSRAFSKFFIMNMRENPTSASYNSDIFEILMQTEFAIQSHMVAPKNEFQRSLVFLQGETDYRIDLPDTEALTYVAAFLIYKCSNKHSCFEMLNVMDLLPTYKIENNKTSFNGRLQIPPQEFIEYVAKLELTLNNHFEKCIETRTGSNLFELLQDITPETLCSCFPTDYLLKLFVRLRIFTILKYNSLLLQNKSDSISTTTHYLNIKSLLT